MTPCEHLNQPTVVYQQPERFRAVAASSFNFSFTHVFEISQGNMPRFERLLGYAVISDLGASNLILTEAIQAKVEMEDGVYLVSISEAGICASGETVTESIDSLKHIIAFNFNRLKEENANLSEALKSRLSALRRFVKSA